MNLRFAIGAVLRKILTAYQQGYPQVLGITLLALDALVKTLSYLFFSLFTQKNMTLTRY